MVKINERTMTLKQILQEVSRETRIDSDVVYVVVHKFIDICVEQITNGNGLFIPGLMNVKYAKTGKKKAPSISGRDVYINKTFPKVSLSDNVKKLYRLQNDYFEDKPYIVNRDTWRGASSWVRSNNFKKFKKEKLDEEEFYAKSKEYSNDDLYNPVIDDDY